MQAILQGWEIVLILAIVLLLWRIPFFLGAVPRSRPKEDESTDAADAPPPEHYEPRKTDGLVLWLACGFGIGRIPWAPGTFGSLIGLLWFAILLSTQYFTLFVLGIAVGLFAAVGICGRAEKILRQRDPGSIVLDEIAAMPICFLAWVASDFFRQGRWPPLETFFGAKTWHLTLILFAAFRLFDIAKPWPVRQSQRLFGGWGVVTDDALAAVYVCASSLVVFH